MTVIGAFLQQPSRNADLFLACFSIDDYFHVEDHREWTFFIGSPEFIEPWWDKLPAKVVLSCIFLIGWPLRMSYKGRVGKHNVEVKKAVFVEYSSQDEGVSLSATPGSSANNNTNTNNNHNATNNSSTNTNNENNNGAARKSDDIHCNGDNSTDNDDGDEDEDDGGDAKNATQHDVINCDAKSSRLDGAPMNNR